ncbi:ammonium transporter [Eubacterium coprostanoligenes]|uniref:Ammonium transporter, Amt family n=1 Tax=Eubacterium coprostanoligenes TaxID=290054 RepID=A0A1T4JSS3_9FIRM|nr:ammonium transporter [Eubacterium coprostanoligenes]MDD6664885.1 ammonium transporter [Eubacterium coprostanoligenes]SJZ33107.1 ammonium transporter, Amt family [Eubacterium coprostanoligenes]
MNDSIFTAIADNVFGVWFLIGAALVFFMQCGFAMVESGFTRAKNAGNIIMKNLMDFCIGALMFILIGYGLMFGENYVAGLFGLPTLKLLTDYTSSSADWSNFVFNLVFCATAATIVSGSMAERTKFSSYCIYSAVISAVVYPIEAGWIWNSNGWLAKMGFHDYAGSTAIHMVGGIAALIGAIFLGPRIGKYVVDKKTGKKKAKAIPGHSLTLGALGVFILWFGWYGFNGAAAKDVDTLASIFLTTTLAPATATCVTMIFTWIKDGKPDVSMSLNASLAGLVAITAPCDCVDAFGSIIIGAVSGILVVVVVEGLDKKLHIDDPVGAVGVHLANGVWGTIAVGLFSRGYDGVGKGLFYGGGFKQLGIQLLGFVAVASWAVITMIIVFALIKKTNGLRVTAEEEIKGLDSTEHNLPSAYADFVPTSVLISSAPPAQSVEKAIPVETFTTKTDAVLSKIVMIFNPSKFEELKEAMNDIGITGMTATNVMGCGVQKGHIKKYRGVEIEEMSLLPKMKLEMVVSAIPVKTVVETARKVLYTGNIGDGKIFVYDVEDVMKVRTGEHGYDALQDVEGE